jgi:hypothetical protein
MSNYPDNVNPADPSMPWNQAEPTCDRCKQELDADALEQDHVFEGDDWPGWPGGLCTKCADSDYDKHGCTCEEGAPCSLACQAARERIERSIFRGIQGGTSRDTYDNGNES